MTELLFAFGVAGLAVAAWSSCGRRDRRIPIGAVSWFDLLPHMTVSKKARGRGLGKRTAQRR